MAPAAVKDPPLPALIRLRYTRDRRGCSLRVLPQCRCCPPDRPLHRDPGKGAGGVGVPMGARSGHSSGGSWGEQSPQPWEECLCPHGLPMLSCRMWDHLAGNQLPIAPVPVRLASDSPVTGMVAGGFILGLGCPSLWTVVQAVQGGVLG